MSFFKFFGLYTVFGPYKWKIMVLKICKIVILLICVGESNASDRRDILYHAVTPIEGLEQLYLNTKPPLEHWKLGVPEFEFDNGSMEPKICWTVITSEHFRDHYKVYPVSNTSDQSRTCHPEEFLPNVSSNYNATIYPYEKREVLIGKRIVHELVFPCFACSYETGEVEEFFISHVYEAQCRFVFKYGDQKKLIPTALAEISPNIWWSTDWSKDKLSTSVFYKDVDTSPRICNKEAAEKVRLCGILLNNLKYRDEHKVRFIPSRNKNPPCEKRVFEVIGERKNVWAIRCDVVKPSSLFRGAYYISDSTKDDKYFISIDEDIEYVDCISSDHKLYF